MIDLNKYFRQYGNPSNEMNERICLFYLKADNLQRVEDVLRYDKRAEEDIKQLQEYIEVIKAYRNTLYLRANKLYTADCKTTLKLIRQPHYSPKYVEYVIKVEKLYNVENAKPITELLETFKGNEKKKAFTRFEEILKTLPKNVEIIKKLDKEKWEK